MQQLDPPLPAGGVPTEADSPTANEHIEQLLRHQDAVLAISTSSEGPRSMYDPNYFVHMFVSLFPNGCGGKPDGMSWEYWARLLMRRYPRTHARHSRFLLTVFDMLSRLSVNQNTFAYNRMTNHDIEVVGKMSERAVQLVKLVMRSNLQGRKKQELMKMAGYGTLCTKYTHHAECTHRAVSYKMHPSCNMHP